MKLGHHMYKGGSGKVAVTPCPICGRDRSNGFVFIDHGKCMDEMARRAKETHPEKTCWTERLSEDQQVRAKSRAAMRGYTGGRLPAWMLAR